MTDITNPKASTKRVNNINACDYSGFQAKPGELVKASRDRMVLPRFWEDRHPLDTRPPPRTRSAQGPLRPEPINDERFVDVEYPNGVTAEDL